MMKYTVFTHKFNIFLRMSKYKGSNPGAVNDLASIMRSQQLNYNNGPNRPRAIDVIEKDGGDLQLP